MFIPIRVDVPMDRLPIVNYVLLAGIFVISLLGLMGEAPFDYTSPVVNTFFHSGLIHLIGNLLFLWVFGNAVNYKFGQFGYIAFYAVVLLGSELAHFVFDGRPAIGASGAISGVMGAFLIFFPRNEATVFWMLWIKPGISQISSGWLIAAYLAWDVFCITTDKSEGVALFAHVGGFVVGIAVSLLCLKLRWLKPIEDEENLLQVMGWQAMSGRYSETD